jgi:hypothetical protein
MTQLQCLEHDVCPYLSPAAWKQTRNTIETGDEHPLKLRVKLFWSINRITTAILTSAWIERRCVWCTDRKRYMQLACCLRPESRWQRRCRVICGYLNDTRGFHLSLCCSKIFKTCRSGNSECSCPTSAQPHSGTPQRRFNEQHGEAFHEQNFSCLFSHYRHLVLRDVQHALSLSLSLSTTVEAELLEFLLCL